MKNKLLKVSLVLTMLALLVACGSQKPVTEEDGKVKVVASIFPMYEMAREIVGDRATVSLMVGSNEDAHHYEPSAQAVASVNDADIFLYSSDEMEFWVQSLLAVVENDELQVVEVGESIDFEIGADAHDHEENEQDDHDEEHDHGGMDPHFWLNPQAIASELERVVEALIATDPEGAAIYTENAERYAQELLELHTAYEEAFADADNKIFVVQHQAFGHLAHEFHIEQVAVGGLTTEVEPNPKQLVEIVNFVKDQNVPVIYYQSGENSAIAETIANETNTEVAILYDLEGAPISEDDLTYMDAMYYNLEQLKKSIR